MANSMVQHVFNGVLILARGDGYWNATAMCQATGKRLNNYLRNQATQDFLTELSSVTRIPVTELVQVNYGGNPVLQGTWIHRRVAVHLAQWADPAFAVRVTGWVEELLAKGRVEITPAAPAAPAIKPWADRINRSVLTHRHIIGRLHGAGHWSAYSATMMELVLMEDQFLRHCLPLENGDLPDGSIGKHWSSFRPGQPWAGKVYRDCPLVMPHILLADGQPLNVCPAVYEPHELPRFVAWLHEIYLPEHLPTYLGRKFSSLRAPLALASAADSACRSLTGNQALLPPPTRRTLALAGGFVPYRQRPPRVEGPRQRELFE